MKALTQLSNKQKTLALFGLLAMNISWMNAGINSGDFASRGDISAACPTIQDKLRLATSTNLGDTIELSCKEVDVKVGRKNREVSRTIYMKAVTGKICESGDAITGAACANPVDGITVEFWTESADESSACEDGECGIVKGPVVVASAPFSAKPTPRSILESVNSELMANFDTEKSDIARNAEDMLEAAERELKEEQLQEALDQAAKNCEVLPNTLLENFEEGQESGDFGEDALEGKERMACFKNQLAKMRDSDEATDYFYNNVMPHLQEQLISGDREEAAAAQSFITQNINGRLFGSLGIDRGRESLAMAALGGQTYQQISAFKKNMNPNDPSSQMHIQMLEQSINARFGIVASNAPAGDYLGQTANYWTGTLNTHLGGDVMNDALIDMSNYIYADNRIARVQPNTQLYTFDSANGLAAQINSAYDSAVPLAQASGAYTPGQQVVMPPTTGGAVTRIPRVIN